MPLCPPPRPLNCWTARGRDPRRRAASRARWPQLRLPSPPVAPARPRPPAARASSARRTRPPGGGDSGGELGGVPPEGPAGTAPLAPVTRGRFLIGQGTMLQPHLLDLSNGQWIGTWLSGSATHRTLTVALLSTAAAAAVRERRIPAGALTGTISCWNTPLLAAGPDGQVVEGVLGCTEIAKTHTAQLMLTSWNATLRQAAADPSARVCGAGHDPASDRRWTSGPAS